MGAPTAEPEPGERPRRKRSWLLIGALILFGALVALSLLSDRDDRCAHFGRTYDVKTREFSLAGFKACEMFDSETSSWISVHGERAGALIHQRERAR
jgi:hypothetical protein